MRTRAFKEQMDKEEIVHLKQEIGQLQEISEAFNHPESPSHLINKRESSVTNHTATPLTCSTSGNCVLIGKFCPHPDKLAPSTNTSRTIVYKNDENKRSLTTVSSAVVFVAQKSSPYNAMKTQVQFQETTLNVGGAFDLKESVFIAPKAGIYEFNFDGHKTGDHKQSLNISLQVNGKEAANTWSDYMGHHSGFGNHDFRNLISMHSLLKLNKGDRIDLNYKQGALHPGNNGNVVQSTQFTGKLLLEGIDWPTTSNNNSNQRSPIYFNVQKNSDYCDSKSPVHFEMMNINVGGAFNLKGNKFITPLAGIYEFFVKGFKNGDHEEMEITLRNNGNRVANAWVDFVGTHNFHVSFSIYSTLKLEKGDRIDLFLVKGCLYDDINHYTTFTGKLLMEYTSNNMPADAVYFNVQKNEPFTTANAIIPFEFGVLNIGGAFNLNENSKEHFFTAPRSGIYEFNVAGVKEKVQKSLFVALRLNGWPVAHVWVDWAPRHWAYSPFSLHSILKVKKGDIVDLFNVGGEGSELHDDEKKLTQFTGKLLYPDDNMV